MRVSPIFQFGLLIFLSIFNCGAIARDSDRQIFISSNMCPLQRLMNYVDDAKSNPRVSTRFFVVETKQSAGGYVQCMFDKETPRLLCEAESGYFRATPGKVGSLVLNQDQLKTLRQAGFDTGIEDGNFEEVLKADRSDFPQVAEHLLGVLYDVYGARPTSSLWLKGSTVPVNHPSLFHYCGLDG